MLLLLHYVYKNSNIPFKNTSFPVFSSLSLGLLPERSATLMVYDDVVQIVSGFQGMLLSGNQSGNSGNLSDSKQNA